MGERVMGGRYVGQRDVGAALMKGRIDLYVSSVTFAGFIALLAASRAQRIDVLDPIMIAVLVGLACLAQRVPVFLFRSSAISVSFAAVIAAYVLYGTGAAVWVSLAQALVNSVTPRRKPLRKAAFNFGSFALSAFAAGELYGLTGGMTPPGAIAPTLVSVAISAAAYFLVSTSLTSVAIAMSEGQNVVAVWRTNYSWMPVNFGATAVQGAALALAYQALGMFGVFVFTVPLCVAWFSFRLYMAKSTEVRQRNEELSTVNELLRQTNDRLEESHISVIGALIGALEAEKRTSPGTPRPRCITRSRWAASSASATTRSPRSSSERSSTTSARSASRSSSSRSPPSSPRRNGSRCARTRRSARASSGTCRCSTGSGRSSWRTTRTSTARGTPTD